jgi:hypothetical protein
MRKNGRAPSADVDLSESLEAIFHGFSCPQEELDESFLTRMVIEHARNVLRLFIDKYAAQLSKCSHGLVELLTEALAHESTPEIAWDPAFGRAFRALQAAEPSEVAQIATDLALHLGAHGCRANGTLLWISHYTCDGISGYYPWQTI